MTPERFRVIEEVFHGALGTSGAERAIFLDRACDGDDDLRRRVNALLNQHDPTSGFLEPPPVRSGDGRSPAPPAVGRVIGGYRIVRLIASGGMGAVYEAEQERPSRRVALKVMRAGLASDRARRRFEFESQVLASLRHPGIAQVYEAGVHDDLGGPVPFFAMELVDGPSITTACAERGLEPAARLALMVRVCDAVQHAHQRGVIHRDIKPSNILVEPAASAAASDPTAGDVPKVIDFGIARVVAGDTPAHTLGTEAGGVLGTLSYMSPEQCAGAARAVDTRSDVYSLGVVLYELMCGKLPYDLANRSIAEAATIIATRAPIRPSSVSPGVRGDLETILFKSLEKEPDRRYQSAGELARDIERFLALQPIEARPPTALYQLRMFARRHRTIVGAAVAMALVLVAATVTSAAFALAARREAARAELSEKRANKRADFLQGAIASANPWFPPSFPDEDLSDYEPWDEWQQSPWPHAGVIGRAVSVADIAMAAGERVQAEFADDPATRARLSDTLGWTLQRLLSAERHPDRDRMLVLAESLLRDALATRRQMLAPGHDDTIRSMMRLAEFLDYTPGGGDEGGQLYDEALRACAEKYGPHDARTLHAMRAWVNNTAFMRGRWEEARARLDEAVAWALDPGAEAPAPVLITLAYSAFVCSAMSDCDQTGARVNRSIAALVALCGPRNIRTAFAQQYAGQAMGACGNYVAAEEHMRAALEGQQAFFGKTSLEAAFRMATLGRIIAAQERWSEAAACLRETHAIFVGIRGPTHDDTISVRWDLAQCLWFAGEDFEESERLALSAYTDWVSITSPVHPYSLSMAQGLAEGGLIARKFERTMEFLDRQVEHVNVPGFDPGWVFTFRKLRAECLAAMGRRDEALVEFDAALTKGSSLGADMLGPAQRMREALARGEELPIPPLPGPTPRN